ncbi:MAG TPA: hypothetical protein VM733_01400, partial [Thermoanaerobaculia bacterium]|nr:hypothetical protein [Thermoanaerobaculia bacterium]
PHDVGAAHAQAHPAHLDALRTKGGPKGPPFTFLVAGGPFGGVQGDWPPSRCRGEIGIAVAVTSISVAVTQFVFNQHIRNHRNIRK